jgi:divalent metal cation (Fe/Co/Zn/Cd) transporter
MNELPSDLPLPSKQPWLSKTIVIQVLTILATLLGLFLQWPDLDPQIAAVVLGVVLPIVNIILRYLTDQPIRR